MKDGKALQARSSLHGVRWDLRYSMSYIYYMFYKYQFSKHFPIIIKMWAKSRMAHNYDHKLESVCTKNAKSMGFSSLDSISYINEIY